MTDFPRVRLYHLTKLGRFALGLTDRIVGPSFEDSFVDIIQPIHLTSLSEPVGPDNEVPVSLADRSLSTLKPFSHLVPVITGTRDMIGNPR